MSGWFRQLLAPRWQHPDAERRQQAASQLDPQQQEGRTALQRLAADDDARVRQAALARFDDIDSLMALFDVCPSPELHSRMAAILVGAAGSTPLAQRVEQVARLTDQQLLQEVALHGDNQQLRLAAVAALSDDDEEALILQACENGIAAVRHAAASRVISETGLQQLVRQARRDKQVARLARERLNALRADAAQQAAAEAERERILKALEQHGHHAWEPLYAGRYRHLQREWEALTDLPSAEQERRYQEACLLCRKTLTDHDAQQHVHAAHDQRREDDDQTREGLLEALEETLESLRRSEHLAAQDIDSLRAQKRLLATRWQALSDHHAPDDTLRQRYDRALEEYDRIGHAWERFRAHAAELDQALTACDRQAAQTLLTACAWPDDLPPTTLLARAQRSVEQQPAPRNRPDPAQFQREVEELDGLLERGAFKSASRLHQRLRQRLEQLPEEHIQRHRPTLKRLGAQLAELRDWRGFVAGPKRDQLCQAIAELAEDMQLSEAALDRRHRQLVKEWASLGDAAADRELSTHFRACSDRIHQRLVPWREALDAERQRNLEAREALCEQLEALLDKPDPDADPDALRDIRDRAREQWRRYSPVPRERAEAIGRRFGRVRHGLQALIDQRAQYIATAKRELIDAAQALLDGDQPSHRRAAQAKQLQQRWRALGRAPKGEEQALWREFRGICDRIFASREAERNDRAQRAQRQLDEMQALIDRLDGWQPTSTADTTILDTAISEAEALDPLPAGRRSDGMRRRWSGIVRARRERLARLAVAEEVSRWQALQPLLNAHLSADAEALSGHPPGDVDADDSLGGDLLSAHRLRNARRREPPSAGDVEESLARLRVHLALLAGSRVGQQDDPLRLAIQVERLNEGLGRELSKAEELHEVLRELFATGPVATELWQREAQELDAIFTQLLRLPPP
ncbi:DUF349 domain-containing protein [Halomonas sp. ML-15]|uniref:DUF349 domain-containing protein n=1 Tax=Halomonas sp. ML-15 TaxID=2773305 RepID=UPI00174787DE|nr:DUF349 domain-containing protein [Halomonas sp. ML-15]MBD3898475.1 DUF349 domain-containing protein [Halomonas sp. ML-15]